MRFVVPTSAPACIAPESGATAAHRAERRRDIRWQVVAVAAVIVTGMAFSLCWAPVVKLPAIWWTPGPGTTHQWIVPGDIWVTMRAAHVIAWGGEGILYQDAHGFITFPGIAVVLAPVAMLCSALHLSESFPFPLAHPTAWILVGPVEMAIGASVVFALGAAARRLGVPTRRRRVLLFLEAAVIWPAVVLWGHPEDLVALALGLYALMAAIDGRWLRAAVLFGAALAFQPLLVLMLPIAFVYIPRRRWLRAACVTAAPSAALLVAPLLAAWRTTTHNLIDQPTYPTTIRSTPWERLSPVLMRGHRVWTEVFESTPHGRVLVRRPEHMGAILAGGPSRIFAVAGALVIAWFVARRRPDEATVMSLVALALGLRCVFESVMIEYYLIPALAVSLLVCAVTGSARLALGAACAAACTYLAYVHAGPWAYYLPVTATLLAAWGLSWPQPFRSRVAERDPVVDGDRRELAALTTPIDRALSD